MADLAVTMLILALFIVFVAGSIAGIVVGTAAVIQRIERRSLKALTTRLSRGEISTDDFSVLLVDQILSQLPRPRETDW